MRSVYRVVIGALVAALIASACQPPATGPSTNSDVPIQGEVDNEAEIFRVVQQWQAETGARGVLAAIATSDEAISVAVGQAGSDTGTRDIRVDDTFDTFSITKTFVAAEILLLADRGILHLDDAVGSHIPELSGRLDVTIRDLLSHRSGLTDHRDHPEFWADFFSHLDREWTWNETVEFVLSQDLAPNEYAYSDSNFVILGHLIEVLAGKPLGEALADDLFGPVGLGQTAMLNGSSPTVPHLYGEFDCSRIGVFGLDEQTTADLESTYCADGLIEADELPRAAIETFDSGASGLVSSLDDLVRWAQALFGGQVAGGLGEALPEDADGYGLGIGSRETSLGPAYGHLGGGAFGQARLWHLPDQGITVVAWAGETTSPDLDTLTDRMLTAFRDGDAGAVDGSNGILDGLKSPDAHVRAATAESLVGSEESGQEVVRTLIAMVTEDPHASVRASAILGLGAIARDSNSPSVIDALQSALQTDPSDTVRRNAALGLGFIGPDALVVLENAYENQPSAVRDAIDKAIRRLKGDI